jgi:hypothetical protein
VLDRGLCWGAEAGGEGHGGQTRALGGGVGMRTRRQRHVGQAIELARTEDLDDNDGTVNGRRKGWQTSLLRCRQRIAFYEASCLVGNAVAFDCHLRRVAYAQWPHAHLKHRSLAHRLRM